VLHSSKAQSLFAKWGEQKLLQNLRDIHGDLVARRRSSIDGVPTGWGDPRKRARANLEAIQQAQLHRVERQLVSSVSLFLEHNIYGVALVTRAVIESAGIIGFFCGKLDSLAAGTIGFNDLQQSIWLATSGARHEFLKDADSPVNIMTCIGRADVIMGKKIGGDTSSLRDSYDWLSEYAHPNFLSNALAYSVDDQSRFVFRHAGGFDRKDFQVPSYMVVAAGIFTLLFDGYSERLADGRVERAELSTA